MLAFDRLVNALFGGDSKETISSRTGKYAAKRSGWFPCKLCRFLDWVKKDHCKNSIESDVGKDAVIWESE